MLGKKEKYIYLGIFEADTIKQLEMKEKIMKRVLQMNKETSQNSALLYSKNLIKEINTLVVSHVRFSRPFLKWTREKLRQMNEKTRKLMTKHKALLPRDD